MHANNLAEDKEMNATIQAIVDAALALPEKERVMVVEQLLESLPPDAECLSEDEFVAELDRRSEEVEKGLSKPIPWSEVKKLP
jgi:putative addiction module component (TIGR02574 family)